MTQLIAIQPNFNMIHPDVVTINEYNRFFQITEEAHLNTSLNLDEITQLANKAYEACNTGNPMRDNSLDIDRRDQYLMDHLSDIKIRLSHAIEKKRTYYDENLLGIITKFVLKLFCMWNDGETPCIQRAIDFEMFWDSEGLNNMRNTYRHADLSNFYNYRPDNAFFISRRG